jgi:4-hydroxy-4-methyl-2-oxoglutarate aldolase
LEVLKQLGAATVHEAQGQKGAIASAIKPINPGIRLAGPALTVDCRPDDNLAIHYALTIAQPGDVIVVDAKGFVEAGPWGDIMTLMAKKVGVAGLVIDGAIRDSDAVIEMGFPIFARGVSIKGTAKNQPGAVNGPIVCGGVRINAGDVVLGDRDGVVVIEADFVPEAIRLSRQREEKEVGFRRAIEGGTSLAELIGLMPVFETRGFTARRRR